MEMDRMKYPFEASFAEIMANPDPFVSMIFSSLESEFLVLPKGHGFIEYPDFEKAYEALKRATCGFTTWDSAELAETVRKTPLCLIVLRTILGFTPPEWAYIATRRTGVAITQGFARALDRKIRMAPFSPLHLTKVTEQGLVALIETAVQLLLSPPLTAGSGELHRLEKADTKEGIYSVQSLAGLGVPYAMLLYERLLGRPFAGHRDSVSNWLVTALNRPLKIYLPGRESAIVKPGGPKKFPALIRHPTL
ncbi:hypothetical protein [Desulfofundulus thermobenzoicus]|uniref:hypothetical protein n=1 Tax=Desulfofundulus thermobenzoicus TaxID=29376 RepID=UPI001A9BAD53|nr:hypothetical protein [Desulfofundulus thermobenzoicus]